MAAKMPSRSRRKDDISEKDEFHLPQIVSAHKSSMKLISGEARSNGVDFDCCSRRKRYSAS